MTVPIKFACAARRANLPGVQCPEQKLRSRAAKAGGKSFMFEWLSELQLNYGYVIKPLIVGTLVSIVCSVIGCFSKAPHGVFGRCDAH
jgi:hypothetical protein